ncbi:hypothetical protein BKA65DRAFT_511461 [Rhexocercosporidium sp. MPI-PUGE-AT-0058]|nr:hypothetical protein BKA65DRAFT_511461 [Rhexocercosporidium sp. MPI-PUGE-AT-0058]
MALVAVNSGSASDSDAMAEYRNRAETFRSVAAAQIDFIQEMVKHLDSTRNQLEYLSTIQMPEMEARYSAKISELQVDLKDQMDSRRRWQSNSEKLEDEVMKLRNKVAAISAANSAANLESSRFVSVLIDADADIYYFADEYLTQGLKGGQAAADMLVEKVREHLLSLGPSFKNAKSIPIVVKAYANLTGLAYHFKKENKVYNLQDVSQFWAGFSQRYPFIDFVDVGSGKEAADNKIRENLRLNIDTPQCEQIFLACAHDGGYVPVLSPYASQASGFKERITLLSTGPGTVHPLIAELGFNTTESLTPLFSQSESLRVDSWRKSEEAAQTKIPPPASIITSSAVVRTKSVTATSPEKTTASTMPYNPLEVDFTGEYFVENAGRLIPKAKDAAGNRLKDNNLIVDRIADYDLIGKMKNLSICQWHYLRSDCSNHRKEKCKRNHDTYRRPLSAKEYDALWYLSRMGYCKKLDRDGFCNDDYCIYGHDD